MNRRRSTKAGCDWADCMCKRCAKDCCLEHENYLCPAGLSEESKQRIARDYGYVLECPDFVPMAQEN